MKVLIVIAVVVACVVAQPLDNWMAKLRATGGQFVLAKDSSPEWGGHKDVSLEFVRPYKPGTSPLVKKAAGGPGHFRFSSEEKFYLAKYLTAQGEPRVDRVKALTDLLGPEVLELSSEDLLLHFNPHTATQYAGGQYYVDDSNEIYYRPGNTGVGNGVQVAKK